MKYLLEAPTTKDEFKGQAHSSAARKLFNNLTNPDVKTVGLEGELGSGKSSILKKAQEVAEKECGAKKIYISEFDAEQYHNNNVNKALINELADAITELVELPQGDIDKVNSARDKALGRVFNYKRNISTSLSWWVVTFATSILIAIEMLPDGIKALGEVCFIGNDNCEANLKITLQILIMFSPIIWGACFCIAKFCFKVKLPKFSHIFSRELPEEINEVINVSNEVGSYELNRVLKTFANVIPEGAIFVLVIDNLDRVPSDELPNVWADLEVFTHNVSIKFKVVVPYSSSHIGKGLSGQDGGMYEGVEFISKRLPIKVKVPPILDTDWKTVYAEYLEAAEFPAPDENKLRVMAKIIQLWLPSSMAVITPRYLKRQVNELVSVLNGFEDISLEVACAYTNMTQYDKCIITEILNPQNIASDAHLLKKQTIESTYKFLESLKLAAAQVKDDFARLHYQVESSLAVSATMFNKLEIALTRNDWKTFLSIDDYGYDEALMDLITTEDIVQISNLLGKSKNEESKAITPWIKKYGVLYSKKVSMGELTEEHISVLINLLNGMGEEREELSAIISKLNVYQKDHDMRIEGSEDDDILKLDNHYKIYDILKEPLAVYVFYTFPALYFKYLLPNKTKYPLWSDELELIEFNTRQSFVDFVTNEEDSLTVQDVTEPLNSIIKNTKIGESVIDEGGLNFQNLELVDTNSEISVDEYGINYFRQATKNNEFQLSEHHINVFSDDVRGRVIAFFIIKEINSGNLEYLASELLEVYTEDTDYKEWLTNDIGMVTSFDCMINALKNEQLQGYIKESVAQVIKTNRVHSLDVTKIFNENYNTLRPFAGSSEVLLKWVSNWWSWVEKKPTKYGRRQFSLEYIQDVLSSENIEYANKFISNLESNIDEYNWQELLTNPKGYEIIENKLYEKVKRPRNNAKPITDAIKAMVKDESVINIEVEYLASLLLTLKEIPRNSIKKNFDTKFWNQSTSNDYREWLINNLDYQFIINRNKKLDDAQQKVILKLFNASPSEQVISFINKLIINVDGWTDENKTELCLEIEANELEDGLNEIYMKFRKGSEDKT